MDDKELLWYANMAKQARGGDYRDAALLLDEFAQLAGDKHSSPLVRYLAECVAAWKSSDYAPGDAAECFNVKRPRVRPDDQRMINRHIKGFRAYYLTRGCGKGREAAVKAGAKKAQISPRVFEKLLENKSAEMEGRRIAAQMMIGTDSGSVGWCDHRWSGSRHRLSARRRVSRARSRSAGAL